MNLTVTLDVGDVHRAFAKLKDKAPHLIAHAINRGMGTGRTVAAREVASDMRVKVAVARERMSIEEATSYRHTATLFASAKRIAVYDLGAKGTYPSRGRGRGVTARTPAGRYPRAFIARMRSGHWGVFERKGRARLPIHELMGPSIAHVFERVRPTVIAAARESLIKNLQSNFKFFTRAA